MTKPKPTTPAEPQGGEQLWVIWSNEHMAWWKPDRCGYTTRLLRAGRYTEAEARKICSDGLDRLFHRDRIGHDPPHDLMMLDPIVDTPDVDVEALVKEGVYAIRRRLGGSWLDCETEWIAPILRDLLRRAREGRR